MGGKTQGKTAGRGAELQRRTMVGRKDRNCQFDQKRLPHSLCDSLIFCMKQKKPRKISRKKEKDPLTNANGYATMELHSVILCPFASILIYNHIIPQNMAAVKR